MPKVIDVLTHAGNSCWIGKKGERFISRQAGKLTLTNDCSTALAFETEQDLKLTFGYEMIDTDNAALLGGSYVAKPLSRN